MTERRWCRYARPFNETVGDAESIGGDQFWPAARRISDNFTRPEQEGDLKLERGND